MIAERGSEGAEQVAEVVGGGQPPAFANRYRGLLLHHGKDRREGEPADAHGDPEGGESHQRHHGWRGLRLPQVRTMDHGLESREFSSF